MVHELKKIIFFKYFFIFENNFQFKIKLEFLFENKKFFAELFLFIFITTFTFLFESGYQDKKIFKMAFNPVYPFILGILI